MADCKYETLREHCSEMERQLGEVRAELREARRRLEGAESQEGGTKLDALQRQVRAFVHIICIYIRKS